MRGFLAATLAFTLTIAGVQAAPTAAEQAAYDAAVQATVDAINTYRAGQGKTAIPALKELCQAAREAAEYATLGAGVSKNPFDRAHDAGFPDNTSFVRAFAVAGHDSPTGLLSYGINNSGYGADLVNAGAASLGVGVAMKADGANTEIRVFVIVAKLSGGVLGGTTGIETGSGRGVVDLTQIGPILAGAYTGDSINGFVYDPDAIVFTTAVVGKFNNALKKLFKKPPVIVASVGKQVTFKLPADVVKLIGKFKVKGKLPPGVKFDKKRGGFRGAPTSKGVFTVRLGGDLKAAINGSKKLKPIKIQFKVGG